MVAARRRSLNHGLDLHHPLIQNPTPLILNTPNMLKCTICWEYFISAEVGALIWGRIISRQHETWASTAQASAIPNLCQGLLALRILLFQAHMGAVQLCELQSPTLSERKWDPMWPLCNKRKVSDVVAPVESLKITIPKASTLKLSCVDP